METKRVLAVIGFLVLIITASYLAYDVYQKKNIIHERNIEINETLDLLNIAMGNIDFLNETLSEKIIEIGELTEEVISKEFKIREITDLSAKQEEEIQHLREVQASLQEEGKIIVDMYGATLVLYDNVDIYEKQSPFMELVKQDPINYGKLGIPFFYFRDESRKVEDNVILGTYSTLYNYIYIYKDNDNIRTIYHEIAHIIYQKVFIPSKSNLNSWESFYSQLKDADLLSTNYSRTSEVEGFAEEYSVYKTGVKDQPEALKNFFMDVDEIID